MVPILIYMFEKEEVCLGEGDNLEVDFGLDKEEYVGSNWREGRVIVDLGVLFTSLTCCQCSLPLDLSKCKRMHKQGVCGYVYIYMVQLK